jgi:tripartite-type tricarboxylate transporter receptor subunit TctC
LFAPLALVAGLSVCVDAVAWPEKSVRILVPYAAGGNTDGIARIAADYFSQAFGQQFVVENRVGAGGAIAAELVAKAAPDGYTLFVASVAQLAVLPLIQTVHYDPERDFAAVSILGSNPLVLGVSTALISARSLQELVGYVRARPGEVAYGSGGTGSLSHLVMIMLTRRADLHMEHVNYKGGSPAMVDLLGGQVPMYFGNVADYLPHAQSPRIRLLATSGERRSQNFPELPTVAESGYPGFRVVTWNGLLAPAHTPPAVISALERVSIRLGHDPASARRFAEIGVEPIGSTAQSFAEAIAVDRRTLGEAVRGADIHLQAR